MEKNFHDDDTTYDRRVQRLCSPGSAKRWGVTWNWFPIRSGSSILRTAIDILPAKPGIPRTVYIYIGPEDHGICHHAGHVAFPLSLAMISTPPFTRQRAASWICPVPGVYSHRIMATLDCYLSLELEAWIQLYTWLTVASVISCDGGSVS
jgi:hypothetical protein